MRETWHSAAAARIRVFVTDDDDDVRMLRKLSVEIGARFDLWVSRNGDDVVELSRETRPDVLLLAVPNAGHLGRSGTPARAVGMTELEHRQADVEVAEPASLDRRPR